MVLGTGDDDLVALPDDEAPSRVISRGGPDLAERLELEGYDRFLS